MEYTTIAAEKRVDRMKRKRNRNTHMREIVSTHTTNTHEMIVILIVSVSKQWH